MPKLTIDGLEIEVPPGTSILQACEQLGIEIPRFCYHERLSVPANCRMCLVEMEKSPKPVASCAMPAGDNMVIHTSSPMVRNARHGVMEFLLINHPLDCPICDQGGECDLQDQAVAYGFDRSRYMEKKRSVAEKNLGPLIKTTMTRCIHCTRCIRFLDEIAGVQELAAVGRGENMEITNVLEASLSSELSGNLADVCPVGALTHKPYAFAARPWELRRTESVDVLDAVGSAIRIDVRGNEVLRVLPRLNEDVNEEWLADKSRYACDGLHRQRLDRPYVRIDGKLRPVNWQEAFAAIRGRLTGAAGQVIGAVAGDLADAESVFALRLLMQALGSPNLDCRQDGAKFDVSSPVGWRFNTTIAGIEKADAILLVGTNPRLEAPLVNARIRKRYLAGGLSVASIGPELNLTYPVRHLGVGPQSLVDLVDGKDPFAAVLKSATSPMIIVGQSAFARADGLAIHALACRAVQSLGLRRDGWNGFNVLHTAAGRVGALELKFVPAAGGRDLSGILAGARSGDIEIVYLLGADEIEPANFGTAFVIYQGHHGDRGAHRADVILPGAAYTEKNATYVNMEGRAQRGRQAAFPPGDARDDWKIIRALSDVLGHRLPFDSLHEIRHLMGQENPVFSNLDNIIPAPWSEFGSSGQVLEAAFVQPIADYYLTDPISRASETMAACSREMAGLSTPNSSALGGI